MAQEMTESRKQFVDMMLQMKDQDEIVREKEKLNKRVAALQKELTDIADRAYQNAIAEKVGEYQQKATADGLTAAQIEAIQQERKEFEANPAAYGIVREKSPIKDEADQKRALEIVELLKDTGKLSKDEEPDFLKMIEGYAERNKERQPAWFSEPTAEE